MAEWRVGRQIPKNLYDGDDDIGRMDTAELAETVVRAVNLFHEDADGLVAENERLRTQLAEVQRELNTWTRETGALIAEEGQRIADLIDNERGRWLDGQRMGKPEPDLIATGIVRGLIAAAEIAREA